MILFLVFKLDFFSSSSTFQRKYRAIVEFMLSAISSALKPHFNIILNLRSFIWKCLILKFKLVIKNKLRKGNNVFSFP
jgi:hypothetical protein